MPNRNLLLYRFIIFNVLAACLAATTALSGFATQIYAADASHITIAITVLFILGWCSIAREIYRTAKALNAAKKYDPDLARAGYRNKAQAKMAWLGDVAEWLVALGLLGTVIGFWMALPESVPNTDVEGAQATIGGLMVGMRTALGTTILGGTLALWHQVNLRLLSTGFTTLWEDRIVARDRLFE